MPDLFILAFWRGCVPLVVLIRISLVTNGTEHLFMCCVPGLVRLRGWEEGAGSAVPWAVS